MASEPFMRPEEQRQPILIAVHDLSIIDGYILPCKPSAVFGWHGIPGFCFSGDTFLPVQRQIVTDCFSKHLRSVYAFPRSNLLGLFDQ